MKTKTKHCRYCTFNSPLVIVNTIRDAGPINNSLFDSTDMSLKSGRNVRSLEQSGMIVLDKNSHGPVININEYWPMGEKGNQVEKRR